MSKPYIICHMGSTVDGRIITESWGENKEDFSSLYEQCHNSFDSQAWMVGRITMEKDFTEGLTPELTKVPQPISRESFVGDPDAESFAIAVDQHGKLGWEENQIDGDHVIEVLTEQVSDDYLFYLQQRGVSYVFGGASEIDFEKALDELVKAFPIKTIMLEGGGHINGSLLNAGLIDEISLLILPLADGTMKSPTSFEVNNPLQARPLELIKVEQLDKGVIWLRYKVS